MSATIGIGILFMFALLTSGVPAENKNAESRGKAVPKAIKRHIIEWHGGVTLHAVVFTVDGVTIGRGARAYAKLIETFKRFPEGSHLVFRYPVDIANLLESIYQSELPLPFTDGFEKERDEFQDVCVRKGFRTSIDAYIQSE